MQLSEKAICIQGFIVEKGLEWRISSLAGPYISYSISAALMGPWDADVMEGVQRKAGWWTSERYFPSPNMRKSISGKRYLDCFIKLSSQQNTQQTMEGRGDIAAVNMNGMGSKNSIILIYLAFYKGMHVYQNYISKSENKL